MTMANAAAQNLIVSGERGNSLCEAIVPPPHRLAVHSDKKSGIDLS
jgi:hypothetical protein